MAMAMVTPKNRPQNGVGKNCLASKLFDLNPACKKQICDFCKTPILSHPNLNA